MKKAILQLIRDSGQITLPELLNSLEAKLSPTFEGRVAWYATTVKLDLEARGLIERIPGKTPQQLRMVK